MGSGEGIACMQNARLLLGAAVADLGTWGVITNCVFVNSCM